MSWGGSLPGVVGAVEDTVGLKSNVGYEREAAGVWDFNLVGGAVLVDDEYGSSETEHGDDHVRSSFFGGEGLDLL
jgi:hypothetical protein